jgi:hypothetical protein
MSKNGAEDANEREALITEICDYILKSPARAKGEEIADEIYHTVVIPDVETDHGNASLTYHLKAAVAAFFKEFEGRLDAISLKHTDGAVWQFKIDTNSARENVLSLLVQYATVYMVIGLNAEIESAINTTFKKAIIYAEAKAMSKAVDKSGGGDAKIDLRESIATLQKTLAREKKADDLFVEALGRLDNVYITAGKGRPRTWTKEALENAVRKASSQIKREKYRTPTLADVARTLNKRNPDRVPLTAKSLGEMLRRYKINWKDIKSHINRLK